MARTLRINFILFIFNFLFSFFISHFLLFIFHLFRGEIRNLGKPVALCKQYYDGGADEVVFLNITSFRQGRTEQNRVE